MTLADISVETNDYDTLGGRLSRARDAKNSSLAQIAKLAGVEEKTLEAWECDRAAPRSNRLAMLAGILGISPSWLLFGRGYSPAQESTSADIEPIEHQLDHLKSQLHDISSAIESVEASLRQATPKNPE
jgi:transcriptional regulator with XRE-family HTH domain